MDFFRSQVNPRNQYLDKEEEHFQNPRTHRQCFLPVTISLPALEKPLPRLSVASLVFACIIFY